MIRLANTQQQTEQTEPEQSATDLLTKTKKSTSNFFSFFIFKLNHSKCFSEALPSYYCWLPPSTDSFKRLRPATQRRPKPLPRPPPPPPSWTSASRRCGRWPPLPPGPCPPRVAASSWPLWPPPSRPIRSSAWRWHCSEWTRARPWIRM